MAATDRSSPKVQAAIASGHIADKIEIAAIGRNCRMSETRQRVARNLQLRRFPPSRFAALRCPNFGHARILRIGATYGEIHGFSVRAERACSFVKIRIKASFHHLGSFPTPFVIFFGKEHITISATSNSAKFRTGYRVAGSGEINLHGRILAQKGRTEIGSRTVELPVKFHRIGRTALLHLRCELTRSHTTLGVRISGMLLKVERIIFLRRFVIAHRTLHFADVIISERVGILITLRRAIRTQGTSHISISAITFCHLIGQSSALCFL